MLEPNVENRAFFNERLTKFCGGDPAVAETAPIEAIVSVVKQIKKSDDAERFFSGMLHWLRSRRPRNIEEALVIAKANIRYCLEEALSDEQQKLWEPILEVEKLGGVPSPQVAFKTGRNITEQLKAGKDVGGIAALAKKALEKKKVPA